MTPNPNVQKKVVGKKKALKGWLVQHYGMGAGIYTVYNSRQKAEYEIREALCECKTKPIKCEITYTIL